MEAFHLQEFSTKYGLYFGIAMLISGAMLASELAIFVWARVRSKHASIKLKNLALTRLQSLDASEKSVLREFYIQGKNTLQLPVDHPVIAGLISSGILCGVNNLGKMSIAGMLTSMKILDFVREKITLDMIDLPIGVPSQQQIAFIRENRPQFMDTLEREQAFFDGIKRLL